MNGTYWLTVLPETSQLRPRIKRALRGVDDDARVTPTVDDRHAEPAGRAYGDKFARGFQRSGASKLGAIVRTVGVGIKFAATSADGFARHIGTAASTLVFASRMARTFSVSLLAAAGAVKLLSGAGLARLSVALGFAAHQANRLATQVARVTSAILVLSAVGKLLSFMNRFAKIAAIATIGTAALIGVVSALASVMGGALVYALAVAGAAIGVFAGAAVGLLGPAIGVMKLGFKGLGEGAKAFADSMKDVWGPADEAFNKMIGERMGPLLTQFRDLRMAVTDTFSGALTPAFGSLTGLMDRLMPRFTGLSTTLGRLGSEVAGALASPANSAALDKMFAASDRFFQNFLGESGLSGLTGGLVQFAATAADTFAKSGQGINDALLRAGEWLRNIRPDQMVAAFAALRTMVSNVWGVLKPIIDGIRAIGAVSAPALAPGMQALGAAISQAMPGLIRMSEILMPALSAVMERLAPVIPALVTAFTPWAGVLAQIAPPLAGIVASLAPLAPLLLVTVGAVKAIAVGMAVYNTAMLLAANATKIARTAWFLFNAAFIASPIGLIVTAIVGLGVALWAFFTKTETGRQLWNKIWTGIKNTVSTVWNWLKTTLANAWTQIGPSVMKIGLTAKEAFGTFVGAVKQVWAAIQPAIAWVGRLYVAIAKWQFGNVVTALKALGAAIGWLWTSVVVPAFNGISAAVQAWWTGAQATWSAATTAIGWVGDKVMWLWQTVAVPGFEAIKAAVTGFWDGVQHVWGLLTSAFDTAGTAVATLRTAFETGFNAVKTVVTNVWNTISGIIDKIGSGIGNVVDKLRNMPVVGSLIPGAADGRPPGFAGGRPASVSRAGVVSGPGTGTSDSILAMISNDEGIVKAAAMRNGGANLVAALNAGWTPSAALLHQMVPGFAEGLNSGADFLRSTVMKEWPSITRIGGRRNDPLPEHPTGNAVDIMIPDYASERGISTGNQVLAFLQKNAEALQVDGIIWRGQTYGYGGSLTDPRPYGVKGNDTAAHYDHLHVILGKGRGAGAAAVGAPSADSISLPGGGASVSSLGSAGAGSRVTSLGAAASAGSGSYRAATDKELTASSGRLDSANRAVEQAGQAVDDRTYARDRAQRRLDELRAAGKDTADAQRSLDVANRELKDATDKQARAKDKAARAEQDDAALREQGVADLAAKDASGSSGNPFDDLGKSLWGGLMETIGLDGSVFSNPFEWPTIKSVMAGVNVLGSALSGGTGSATSSTNAGGDPSGLLGAFAESTGLDALAKMNPASDIAAPAINVAPDTTTHGTGNGQAPGPAVVIENAGMAPKDVANTLDAQWNARTRTTKVR